MLLARYGLTVNINRGQGVTYLNAGVNINAGNELARRIGLLARPTLRPEVISGIGGFAGAMSLPSGLEEPILIASTDGVGTKLKLAFATRIHHTIGIDLVAMGVNDILTKGAEPLFFLDYFATSVLDVEQAETVLSGIVEGCRQAGCTLLGGETAEMPGIYSQGEYDLAGFAVGVVEKKRIIDGTKVRAGDLVLGFPSTGLHSNGYSLARKVLQNCYPDLNETIPGFQRSLGAELLEPTRIYAAAVRKLLAHTEVHALAHITGGGLLENPPRVIPDDLAFLFVTSAWTVPPIMRLIASTGPVEEEEMHRTFNMGLGLIAVVPQTQASAAQKLLAEYDVRIVGEIIPRRKVAVEFT